MLLHAGPCSPETDDETKDCVTYYLQTPNFVAPPYNLHISCPRGLAPFICTVTSFTCMLYVCMLFVISKTMRHLFLISHSMVIRFMNKHVKIGVHSVQNFTAKEIALDECL